MELYVETTNDINEIDYNTFFYPTMCHVCKKFGEGIILKRCSGCKMIFYCGREHQKQHWSQHKSLCKAIQNLLQEYRVENQDASLEEWNGIKENFMAMVSNKLERSLMVYETEMFRFSRECAICYEWDNLEDCQNCLTFSFCKDHKDSKDHKHEEVCDSLKLCLYLNLFALNKQNQYVEMNYLQDISDTDIFQDMDDFINIHVNIQTCLEMAYKICAVNHSQYLTRPLTLFHAMRILEYVPKRKDLVIHVIAASSVEEVTIAAWEVLLHLIKGITSLTVIMIGPELKCKPNEWLICSNCSSQKKEFLFEFHNVLYENYVGSSPFVKPDLVVGFNAGIQEQEYASPVDMWAPSIQILAKQECPFILTCYMQEESEMEIDRINTILDRKVEYFYSGKNPFACLRPFRVLSPDLSDRKAVIDFKGNVMTRKYRIRVK